LIRYHASWVLPINEPPLHDAWVAVDRGRIVALGRCTRRIGGVSPQAVDRRSSSEIDLGDAAILPGLVNAHTHLELSYLADQVPPASNFTTWIRQVIAARRERPDPRRPEILDAMQRAIRDAAVCGTAVVGDISNTLVSIPALAGSPLAGVVFYELIRFNPSDAEALVRRAVDEIRAAHPAEPVRASLAAHAPYSVAPLLLREIKKAVDRLAFVPCSVHVSESIEEIEFIQRGTGPWRTLLEELGAWDARWIVPGVSPVQYLDEAGFLDGRVLAVHGVQMTPADLSRLAARGSTLVTCPRSNGHTGAGAPPLADFYRAGVRVAVGTDSLASAPDLNVFAELATMRALAPDVPAASLLESATRHGAAALGFDADYGTIEPGKRASLLAVTLPPRLADVEEYLVTGIQPDQIRWIE